MSEKGMLKTLPPQVWISSPAEHRTRPSLHPSLPTSSSTLVQLAVSAFSSSSCTCYSTLLLLMAASSPAKPCMDSFTTGCAHANLRELKAKDFLQPWTRSPSTLNCHSSTDPHTLASESNPESRGWAHQMLCRSPEHLAPPSSPPLRARLRQPSHVPHPRQKAFQRETECSGQVNFNFVSSWI